MHVMYVPIFSHIGRIVRFRRTNKQDKQDLVQIELILFKITERF